MADKKIASVQAEFGRPCRRQFAGAVEAMRYLVRFHDPDAMYSELRRVVEGKKEIAGQSGDQPGPPAASDEVTAARGLMRGRMRRRRARPDELRLRREGPGV